MSHKSDMTKRVLNPVELLLLPALNNIHLWTQLAWIEVVQNYRRTLLGPFWITFNLTIFASAMTLVYGALFAVNNREYAAFVVCGMIVWSWISALLVEVGQTFLNYGHFLKGTRIDKSLLVWTTAFKQVIILAHHLLVYLGLLILGIVTPTLYTLFAIPAFIVLFVISIPVIALAAILFARFRDLPRLVSSTIVVLMMITPVFWHREMISGRRALLVDFNPLYYLVEFIRRPLLGLAPDPYIVGVVLAMTILLWTVGALLYKRYERYVIFWI